MIGGILVTGLFWVLGLIGLRWGLRLRRGESRLPSDRWGKNNAVALLYGDPDKNMLTGSIFILGLAVMLTAVGVVLATSNRTLGLTAAAVGGAVWLGTALLWFSVAVFKRPQGLLPPHLRKKAAGQGRR